MKRYSAKLLFQYRVDVKGVSNKKRICEERIVTFQARSDKDALRKAKSRGAKGQHEYPNQEGFSVSFEFVGVRDLVCLETICEKDEVWYDIKKYLMPLERKDKFIPADEELLRRT